MRAEYWIFLAMILSVLAAYAIMLIVFYGDVCDCRSTLCKRLDHVEKSLKRLVEADGERNK
jgi:hypothetical protein